MTWLLVILLILLVVISYLLFAPFYLEVNSVTGIYCVRFHRLAAARLVTTGSSLKLEFRMLGWTKQISLSETGKQKEKPTPEKKKVERKGVSVSFSTIKAVIKTFKVNECHLLIDTGSMPLNGILYPGFYWLSELTGKTFRVNFQDKNEIVLEIENNFARILRAFIFHQFIIKNKKHGQLK